MEFWKKSFPIDYEEIYVRPSKSAAIDAVAKHCGHRGWDYTLCGENENGDPLVTIEGVPYCVLRRRDNRGSFSIFCREV